MFTSLLSKIGTAVTLTVNDLDGMFAYASGQPYYWFVMAMFFVIYGEVAVPAALIGLTIFAFVRFINNLRQL